MALIYEKQKITLSFKKDKPEVYRIKPVRQQAVTFDDLLDEVSNSCGVNRAQTKAVLEGLIDRMIVFMNYGMPVKLGDFGSFKPTFNSKTGATADDVTSENVTRKKILFYPGKRFKQMLEDISVTTMEDYDEEEDTSGSPSTTTDPEGTEQGGTGQGGTDPEQGGGGFT